MLQDTMVGQETRDSEWKLRPHNMQNLDRYDYAAWMLANHIYEKTQKHLGELIEIRKYEPCIDTSLHNMGEATEILFYYGDRYLKSIANLKNEYRIVVDDSANMWPVKKFIKFKMFQYEDKLPHMQPCIAALVNMEKELRARNKRIKEEAKLAQLERDYAIEGRRLKKAKKDLDYLSDRPQLSSEEPSPEELKESVAQTKKKAKPNTETTEDLEYTQPVYTPYYPSKESTC